MTDKVLVIGAGGQIGTELVEKLNEIHARSQIIDGISSSFNAE